MADKTLNQLSAISPLGASDLFFVWTSANEPKKITASSLGSLLGLPRRVNRETIIATKTLVRGTDYEYQFITASGANRDVVMWGTPTTADWLFIENNGTSNNVVLKESAGTVISTLVPGAHTEIMYDGNSWRQIRA